MWGAMPPHYTYNENSDSLIPQLDGYASLNSSNCNDCSFLEEEEPACGQYIPVQVDFRPSKLSYERLPSVRKTIRKCRVISNQFLPSISTFNARSLFPKIYHLVNDMKERSTDI